MGAGGEAAEGGALVGGWLRVRDYSLKLKSMIAPHFSRKVMIEIIFSLLIKASLCVN